MLVEKDPPVFPSRFSYCCFLWLSSVVLKSSKNELGGSSVLLN